MRVNSEHDIPALLEELFPVWPILNEDQRSRVASHAIIMHKEAGSHVHTGGSTCDGVMILMKGSLRAFMLSPETGREITLFNVEQGSWCVLSASCVLSMITFDIFVDAIEDCELLVIDPQTFSSIMDENIGVEAYVYRQAAEHFSDVMWVMQQVMFTSLDSRLAVFLLDEIARTGTTRLEITHDDIARNLGSAREVISRALKKFDNKGIVELSRGVVTILDKNALRGLIEDAAY